MHAQFQASRNARNRLFYKKIFRGYLRDRPRFPAESPTPAKMKTRNRLPGLRSERAPQAPYKLARPSGARVALGCIVRRLNMPRTTPANLLAVALALSGCGSTTTVQITPSPQDPVCAPAASAMILWTTEWRSDQKDVSERELAAADGLNQFFKAAGCFKSTSIRRIPSDSSQSTKAEAAAAIKEFDKVVLITIRELGPVIKIGASLALVEGGTEVVLDASERTAPKSTTREFTTVWRSGGPGVIKGVGTLPQDLQAALIAALQPPSH
jgi:hypothetical protein